MNKSSREVNANGDVFWRNAAGSIHRDDGPAIELVSGTKQWRKNGVLHREGGPAIEYADGSAKWFIDGVERDGKPLPIPFTETVDIRDYFAASVLEGIMLNSIMLKSGNPSQWANDAYAIADAMLAARKGAQ